MTLLAQPCLQLSPFYMDILKKGVTEILKKEETSICGRICCNHGLVSGADSAGVQVPGQFGKVRLGTNLVWGHKSVLQGRWERWREPGMGSLWTSVRRDGPQMSLWDNCFNGTDWGEEQRCVRLTSSRCRAPPFSLQPPCDRGHTHQGCLYIQDPLFPPDQHRPDLYVCILNTNLHTKMCRRLCIN